MTLLIGLAAIAAAGPVHGAQVLTEWGTVALTSSYGCPAACTNNDFLGSTVYDIQGGVGILGAHSVLPGGDPNGASQAMVSVVGGLAVPELKAEAISTALGGAAAFTVAAQAYEYTGGAGTIAVDVDLTGSLNNPGLSTLTSIEVRAGLIRTNAPLFTLDSPTNMLGLLLAIGAIPLLADSHVTLLHTASGPVMDLGNTLTLNGLSPGDTFYLVAGIVAASDGAGQFADAFSTVSMEFTQGAGELAVTSVPLPGVAWLFAAALGGLYLHRRPLPA